MSSSYPYSDEDSTDSDSGIRFKTTNTRHHVDKKSYDDRIRTEYQHRRNRSKSRSRSRDRYNRKTKEYRRNRHRSRTPEKYDKHEKHRRRHSDRNEKNDVNKDDGYGPKLPPKKEEPSTSSGTIQTQNKDENDDVYGPTLPPPQPSTKQIKKNNDAPIIIGPTLPLHLRQSLSEVPPADLPPKDSDSDDEFVGPLPAGHSSTNPSFMKLEERALEIKLNGLNKPESDNKVREEWMLELPEVHTANLGLGPRQFRAKGVPDMSDRSSWTDTPQDKQNKESNKHKSSSSKSDLKREAELEHLKQRDLEQAKIVDKHKKKKKRDKSLLSIHQEKLNKKKKEESSKEQVRRPFSRDIDLKANRFDEAQKKSILKKAQLLDNRFSSGESKFL